MRGGGVGGRGGGQHPICGVGGGHEGGGGGVGPGGGELLQGNVCAKGRGGVGWGGPVSSRGGEGGEGVWVGQGGGPGGGRVGGGRGSGRWGGGGGGVRAWAQGPGRDGRDPLRLLQVGAVSGRVGGEGRGAGATSVTAPISGMVVNLRFKTVGGVIRAGEPIVDIVPDKERLLIEARVSPTDIDVVHPGLAAQVHLTAFSKRAMPRIDGVVKSISADRLVDPESSHAYYMARVEVDRS